MILFYFYINFGLIIFIAIFFFELFFQFYQLWSLFFYCYLFLSYFFILIEFFYLSDMVSILLIVIYFI